MEAGNFLIGCTVIGTVVSVIALWVSQRQLSASKFQIGEAVKPFPILTNSRFNELGQLTFELHNVGVGPSLNTDLVIWLVEIERDPDFDLRGPTDVIVPEIMQQLVPYTEERFACLSVGQVESFSFDIGEPREVGLVYFVKFDSSQYKMDYRNGFHRVGQSTAPFSSAVLRQRQRPIKHVVRFVT